MTLEEAAAELSLGLLRPESIPDLCTAALVEGFESDDLAVLAGECSNTLDPIDTRERFRAALRKLAIPIPPTHEAVQLLSESAAAASLRGALTPHQALHRIVREVFDAADGRSLDREYVGDAFGIERLVGLYWDYDELDQPGACSRAELDQEALQALQRFLNSRAA